MLNKIYNKLIDTDMDVILVTDPHAIKYLIKLDIDPGERMYVLSIKNGHAKLFLSKLFDAGEIPGVDVVYFLDTDDYLSLLKSELDKVDVVGIDKMMPARFLFPIMDLNKKFVLGSYLIDDLRSIKDQNEIELMRNASKINDAAMARMEELLHEDFTELEMREKLQKIYSELSAEGFSFEPIVGYGEGSWDPHHVTNENKKMIGDSIVVDMGCIKDGYCSDMTRTFFYKKVSDEAKKIYELVRRANEEAIKKVAPGVKLCEIDAAARNIIEEAGYGKYFTHRTGHFIGTEVHEVGDVSMTNENEAKVGNIFSIEPGIYVPDVCGVRIEDLVLVTENGCEVLNSYPKELKIIE